MGMNRRTPLFWLMLLVALPAMPHAITISGTVSGYNTILAGAHVELLDEGIPFANTTTGASGEMYGKYRFENILPGMYMLRVSRLFYATHVRIVNATSVGESGNQIDVVLSKISPRGVTPATLYGKITSPVSPEGRIYLWKDGRAKWAEATQGGLFVISALSPGEYIINVTRGEYSYIGTVELSDADAKQVFITLAKEEQPPAPDTTPKISVPVTARQGEVIEITVRRGSAPAAGETIGVATPEGQLALISDSAGKAYITAVSPGTYSFTFANASARLFVGQGEGGQPPAGQPPVQEQPPPPPAEQQESSQGIPSWLALAGIALATLAGIAAAAFMLWKVVGKMKVAEPKAGETTPEEIPSEKKPEAVAKKGKSVRRRKASRRGKGKKETGK